MKKNILGIIILALIMIALPLHLRFADDNPTLAGTEPYYHTRMAMKIQHEIPDTDDSILNGRPYMMEPYHLMMSGAYALIGPLAFTLLPAIFAFTSVIFFWLVLRKLNVPEKIQAWILLAYALSPPLISIGTIGTPHAFALTLILAGAWLINTRAWIAGIIALTTGAITGAEYTIAAFMLILFLYLVKGNKKRTILSAIPVITVFIIGYYPPKIETTTAAMQYFSDLGGTYGFSIFAALLAIVGAVLLWKHKKEYYSTYAITIIFLITSFFKPGLLVFANILISGLAGVALAKLAQRKWKISFLRDASLLVLFCGLLFSGIAHAVNTANMQPTPEIFKALEFPPGTVLSHEKYGFWIESAGHKAVQDQIKFQDDREYDISLMLYSNEIEKTMEILKKYNITHIMITPEMKHGLVWERENEGLDFLVENSETFKKLETGTNVTVWRIQ